VVQSKTISDDDIVSVLDCVKENFSEVESNDSDNEIGFNQDSDRRSGTSGCEQSGVPQWHDVHIKYYQNTLCVCICAKKA
jgi:NADPH-dependent 7-cyano-7-deazaguanine reductase QueF